MNLKQCTQKLAYQMSSSNKYTLGATLRRQGEFPLVPERLPNFTTSELCVQGRGGLSCFKLHTVVANNVFLKTMTTS